MFGLLLAPTLNGLIILLFILEIPSQLDNNSSRNWLNEIYVGVHLEQNQDYSVDGQSILTCDFCCHGEVTAPKFYQLHNRTVWDWIVSVVFVCIFQRRAIDGMDSKIQKLKLQHIVSKNQVGFHCFGAMFLD